MSRLSTSSSLLGVSTWQDFVDPSSGSFFARDIIWYGLMFEILSKLGFQGKKNPWGCGAELVLKRPFSAVCPLHVQIWRAGGARPCQFFSRIWGRCQKCFRGCGAEGFSVFWGFFFSTPFSQTSSGPLHIPLFFFGCFLFCSHFSWDWGQRRIARVFLGSWPSTLLIFGGFWGLLTKTLFSPWKRVILVHFSVSPLRVSLSFSLASFTSLCLSLSLIFLSCFSFFVVLSLFLPSLFFAVFSCLFSLLFHEKNNIKILHLKAFFS